MRKFLRHSMAAAIGVAIAFGFGSCTYDPYYSSAGGYYSSGYSSGYGDGYGYGGSGFSTSLFVSTGDPRWGYDPYCHSYYDYRSRRYYDPYLYGYYPVGYRPVFVTGAPHPHGWRPGRGNCPPPRTIRNVTVPNYRNRESAYRSSNYSWAKQVRAQSSSQTRERNQRPSRTTFGSPSSSNTPNYQPRNSSGSSYSGRTAPSNWSTSGTRNQNVNPQGTNSNYRQKKDARLPSGYNTPVVRPSSRQNNTRQRDSLNQNQSRPPSTQSRPASNRQPAQPANQPGGDRNNRIQPDSDGWQKRGIRSLGQG